MGSVGEDTLAMSENRRDTYDWRDPSGFRGYIQSPVSCGKLGDLPPLVIHPPPPPNSELFHISRLVLLLIIRHPQLDDPHIADSETDVLRTSRPPDTRKLPRCHVSSQCAIAHCLFSVPFPHLKSLDPPIYSHNDDGYRKKRENSSMK